EFWQPPREICQALGFKRTVINHNVTAVSQDLAEDTEEMPVGGPDRQPRGIQSAPVLLPAVFARGQTTERGCGRKGACRSIAGEADKQSQMLLFSVLCGKVRWRPSGEGMPRNWHEPLASSHSLWALPFRSTCSNT